MGVPSRFAIEYPQRALELIQLLEDEARQRDVVGSFGLLAAAAVLTIPYERMKASHFLHDERQDQDLVAQIKRLGKVKFQVCAILGCSSIWQMAAVPNCKIGQSGRRLEG